MSSDSQVSNRVPSEIAEDQIKVLSNDGERFLPVIQGEVAFEHYHRYLIAKAACSGKVVADIACGEGYGSAILANVAKEVLSFDISEPTIERARRIYKAENLAFMTGDAHNLPLKSKSCDVVISFETIEHLADPDRFLSEVVRLLRRGGVLIISTPDKAIYGKDKSEHNKFHVREFYREEFDNILKKYFKNVVIYGQQYFEGSVIFDGPRRRRKLNLFRNNRPEMLFAEEPSQSSGSNAPATYMLAVAGNGSLPELPLTLFASADHPQLFKQRYISLNEELDGRTKWLRDVQQELETTRATLQAQLTSVKGELGAKQEEFQKIQALYDDIGRQGATLREERDKFEQTSVELENVLEKSTLELQARCSEIDELRKAAATVQQDYSAARMTLQAQIVSVQGELSAKQEELSQALSRLDLLEGEAAAVRVDKLKFEQQSIELEKALASSREEIVQAKDRCDGLESVVESLREEKTRIEQLNAELDKALATTRNELQSRYGEVAELQKAAAVAQHEANELSAQKVHLESRLADTEARLAEVESGKEESDLKIRELEQILGAAQDDLRSARDTVDELGKTAAEALIYRDSELELARGKIAHLESSRERLDRELSDARSRIESADTRYGALLASFAELELAKGQADVRTDELTQSVIEMSGILEARDQAIAALGRRLDEIEEEKARLESLLATAALELEASVSKQSVLEDALAKLEEYLAESEEKIQRQAAEYEFEIAAVKQALVAQAENADEKEVALAKLEHSLAVSEERAQSQAAEYEFEISAVKQALVLQAENAGETIEELQSLAAAAEERAKRIADENVEVKSSQQQLRHAIDAREKLLGSAVEEMRKVAAETYGQRWLPRTTKRLVGRDLDPQVIAYSFDREFYLKRNSDVSEAGVDPLLHYLSDGWKEGRVHSAIFDDEYYLSAYPELAELGIPPLYHYCSAGWREGRDPSALFDTNYYLDKYPDAETSGLDPLSYFIHHGIGQGHKPSAQFDPVSLLENSDRELAGFELAGRFIERIQTLASSLQGIALPTAVSPAVSVVIPVYNKVDFTLSCLKSIQRFLPTAKFEVIIVDDVSHDLTPLVVPTWMGVRYLRNSTNLGFVGSCNRGAAEARGSHILFLNNDTEVTVGWLDELLTTYSMHGNVGIVGSKLIYPDRTLQEAGGIIWEDGSGWNYGRGQDPEKPEFNYVRDVDYVSGAALMIDKGLFWAIGGFDRRYQPAYFEDADLAFSVRQLGYRVLYQPLSCVIHHEGVSAGTDLGAGMKRHQVINRPKFLEKWAEPLTHHLPNAQTPHIARERNRRYRVLMIDATTPTPDMDAGSVTQSYTIQVLQELGFKVTFIPEDNFTHIGKYTTDLQRRGVETIYHPYAKSVAEHLEAHGHIYDLIMPFKAPRVAKYFDDLRRLAPQAKIIVNTADVHFLRMMREAEVSGSASKMLEALETREIEFDIFRRADSTIIVSSEEMELLRRELPEAKVEFLSLILEAPGLQCEYDQLKDICFLGGFRHNPNVDAVLYFHREIWPLVTPRLPGVRFRIMGSHPPEEILSLASEDVLVDGYVEDLASTLGRCRLSVAPLRFGAGVKGKIGNSLAHGIPAVSTPIGSEGMGLVHGREILVADDPVSFAENIFSLYTNKALWTDLSTNGVAFIRRAYSVEAAIKRMSEILSHLDFTFE